jgi:hypothetical protein
MISAENQRRQFLGYPYRCSVLRIDTVLLFAVSQEHVALKSIAARARLLWHILVLVGRKDHFGLRSKLPSGFQGPTHSNPAPNFLRDAL